jgi:hypothetical protein
VIEADRDKLIKCLRMFSSSFDGEIASAARRAHELVSGRKLDWDDLIVKPGRQHEEPRGGFGHDWERQYQPPNNTIADIRRCQELETHLTSWETEFVNSIAGSIVEWGRLTEKQQAVLDRIVTKLKLAGLWEDAQW